MKIQILKSKTGREALYIDSLLTDIQNGHFSPLDILQATFGESTDDIEEIVLTSEQETELAYYGFPNTIDDIL
jgi:hypothetical protein